MKTPWATLLLSLSIHAFVGYPLFFSGAQDAVSLPEPIPIAYVSYEKPRLEEKAAPPPKLVAPKIPTKKILFGPVKKEMTRPPASPVKTARAKISQTVLASSRQERPRTAVDFMKDSQKGKIFFDYFGKLKEKIHLNLRRKYAGAEDSPGSAGTVTLYFVLNPDGSLAKAGILEKESVADATLRQIALDSLKDSSPFGGFPRDLGNGPLAFNLKIYFDELDR